MTSKNGGDASPAFLTGQVFKWEEKGESLGESEKLVLEEIKKIVVYK